MSYYKWFYITFKDTTHGIHIQKRFREYELPFNFYEPPDILLVEGEMYKLQEQYENKFYYYKATSNTLELSPEDRLFWLDKKTWKED